MITIRIYGDPVLRMKAMPVTQFDRALKLFIEEMKSQMYQSDGVGLAAPQGIALVQYTSKPVPAETKSRNSLTPERDGILRVEAVGQPPTST